MSSLGSLYPHSKGQNGTGHISLGSHNSLSDEALHSPNRKNEHITTSANQAVLSLCQTRDDFAAKIPFDGDDTCNTANRAAILDVYNEAINKLRELPHKHVQIISESSLKARILLSLLDADADHPVFSSVGQLLRPLEPQYANPRIEAEADEYGHRAQRRLDKWRQEGWPDKYPKVAIETEIKSEKLVGRKMMSDIELRDKYYNEEGILNEEALKREETHRTREMEKNKGMGRGKARLQELGESSKAGLLRKTWLHIEEDDEIRDKNVGTSGWEDTDGDEMDDEDWS
jgi:hypothetical protein